MSNDKEPSKSWLERLSNALLREPQDREQLIMLLRDAKARNILNNQTLSMIESLLSFSEMQVRDVMVDRAQMIVLEDHFLVKDALPIVIESAHSRFPVMNKEHNKVFGILLAKDLLDYTSTTEKLSEPIINLIRPAKFVPESKKLDVLLQEFRQFRNHMAIVVDEYGGIAGLITIEDVLEEIVGDIIDETDEEDHNHIRPVDANNYIVKALTPIEEFNEYFHTQYSDEEFDTIGGVIMQHFGHCPNNGETTTFDHFRVQVLQADERHIELMRFTKL